MLYHLYCEIQCLRLKQTWCYLSQVVVFVNKHVCLAGVETGIILMHFKGHTVGQSYTQVVTIRRLLFSTGEKERKKKIYF